MADADQQIALGGVVDTGNLSAAANYFLLPAVEPGPMVVPTTAPEVEPVPYTTGAVSGGPRTNLWSAEQYAPPLVPSLEKMHRRFGDQVYHWLLLEPKIGGSVDTIRQAVLGDDMQVTQNIPFPDEDAAPDPAREAEAERSAYWAKFVSRAVANVDVVGAFYDLMLCMATKLKCAEITWRDGDGEDRNRLYVESIRVLPRRMWFPAVDDYNNVRAVVGRAATPDPLADAGETKAFPREKFVLMNWFPRDNDPMGTTVLDRAAGPWNFKLKLWPKFADYVEQFGAPSIVGTCSEIAKPRRQRMSDDPPGKATGPEISAEADLTQTLVAFASSRVVGLPHGYTVEPFEVAGTGEAHQRAFDICDREMVFAILQTARATIEAQHGSKADSGAAQDFVGLLVRMCKLYVSWVIRRDVFYTTVRINGGAEEANRYTPLAQLGTVGHEDFAQAANAVANLSNAGMLPVELKASVLKFLGMPSAPAGEKLTFPKPDPLAEKPAPATPQPLQKSPRGK